MSKKSINVRRALSLVLTLAMMLTMVLPANMFAAGANPGTVSTDLDEKTIVIGQTVEYTVSTVANDDLGTMVKGKFTVEAASADDMKIEYYETAVGMEGWYDLPTTFSAGVISGEFGPVGTGFPMSDATSTFRVTFAKAGTYAVRVSAVAVADDSELCYEELNVTALDYANYAALNAAVAAGNAVNADKYTAGSYAVLQTALANAAAVDTKLTEDKQSQIDALTAAINDAIAALVEEKVVSFAAVAVANDAAVDYAKADKIYLVFAEAIASGANVLSALTINGEAADTYVANPTWIDNTIYCMDLKANHGLSNGAAIKFAGDEAVKAVAGYALGEYATTIIGNLEEAYENVTADSMAATIVKGSEVPGVANGDKIVLVFNAPVYKTPATIEVSGMTATAVSGTSNTVYQIVLDGSEALVAGQTLSCNGMSAVLNGSFGVVIIPKAVRALIADEDGTALTNGDKIYVFFDTPTNKAAGTTESSFTGVLAGAAGKWIDNQTLEITLGTTAISASDKIDLTSLGIMDVFGLEPAVAANIALEGSFGVAIQPALLTVTAVSAKGTGAATAGDKIYIAFNVKMRENKPLNLSDFEFNYGDYGTNSASVEWATGAEYADYSTIVITLGEQPNVVPGVTKISIDMDLYEKTGTKKCLQNNLENCIVTGTFGTSIAPTLINASIVKKIPTVGAQAGDQIVLLFNTPTNGADIANLLSVSGKSFGVNYEGAWSNNNTVYTLTLGLNPTVGNGEKIAFNNDGTLKDINGQKSAAVTTEDIRGSFGEAAEAVGISPSSVVATIVKTTTKGYAQQGDTIVFAFNVATNGADLASYLSRKGVFGTNPTGGWNAEKTLYTLTLGANPTVADNANVEFTTEAGIKDAGSINAAVTLSTTLIGSFGKEITPVTPAPQLLSATIVKGENNNGTAAQAGDTIVIVFNMATNKSDKLLKDLGAVFGDGATGEWNEAGTQFTITLGTGATIADNATLKITAAACLTDALGYSEAVEDSTVLLGSFGAEVTPVTPAPQILSATIVKGANNNGTAAQAGDTIVIVFNMATNKSDKLLKDLGAVFGDGATGEWNEAGTQFTITLGTGATIADKATLKITAAAGLTDALGYSKAVEDSTALLGSFGAEVTPVTPAPQFLSATIVKGAEEAGAQVGDKVVLLFNMATNKSDKLLDALGGTALFGKNAAGEWNEAGTQYTISIGSEATIADDTTLKITAAADLKDASEYSKVVEASTAMIGSFGIAVAPVAPIPELIRVDIIKKVPAEGETIALGAQKGDQLRFIFNIATNQIGADGVKLENHIIQTVGGESLKAAIGTGAAGEWNATGNIYTLTLGENPTLKESVELKISASAGIKDSTGTSATKEYPVEKYNGSFGVGITPVMMSAVAFSKDSVDYINVYFNIAVKATEDNAQLFKNNNNYLGKEPELKWISDTIVQIKLGENHTIKNTDILHFEDAYKIYSKDGSAVMKANATVPISGELRKPMVVKVIASAIEEVENDKLGKLVIVFSSKTGGEDVDLSSQSASLGIGATASWNDAKTELTILLGEGRTLSAAGGYVLLNGLGITNGFDDVELVGQYSISEGTLPADELVANDARVNAKEDGNYLTVRFNVATNMLGKKLGDPFGLSDNDSSIKGSHSFGTGASATWTNGGMQLEIKLGEGHGYQAANSTDLVKNATISISGLKFANGLGKGDTITVDVKDGSFDGREIAVSSVSAEKKDDYVRAAATITKQDLTYFKGDQEKAVVTFVIWDAEKNIVADMNAVELSMAALEEIEVVSKFAISAASKVEVYVTDTYIDAVSADTPAFKCLAITEEAAVVDAPKEETENSGN